MRSTTVCLLLIAFLGLCRNADAGFTFIIVPQSSSILGTGQSVSFDVFARETAANGTANFTLQSFRISTSPVSGNPTFTFSAFGFIGNTLTASNATAGNLIGTFSSTNAGPGTGVLEILFSGTLGVSDSVISSPLKIRISQGFLAAT